MEKSTNRIIFWTVVILLIIGSVFLIIRSHTKPSDTDIPPISNLDWTTGNKDSNIILIEYSDFQCPACVGYHTLMKEVTAEFSNHVLFIYRHFPLEAIHKNARLASQSAEAAGKQGKFWEMYDMIFENQADWAYISNTEAENIFTAYAMDLGLNVKQFLEDIDSKEVKEKVDNDLEGALSAELIYTPTFILNGIIIKNPRSLEEFRSLIRQAIEENT